MKTEILHQARSGGMQHIERGICMLPGDYKVCIARAAVNENV